MFGSSTVYAQPADWWVSPWWVVPSSSTTEGSATPSTSAPWASSLQQDFVEVLEMVLRILFLVTTPLLALAALALDNSLIYGSVFYLDVSLWQFWQIMRNFANFALWWIFVWKILEYFFRSSTTGMDIAKTIKSVLLSAILIQASWFIMAVLIDLSTIGIYSVWAIPLTVIDNQEDLRTISYPVTHTMYNLDSSSADSLIAAPVSVYYSCPGLPNNSSVMLACKVANGHLVERWARGEPDTWEHYKHTHIEQWNAAFTDTDRHISADQIADGFCVFQGNILYNRENARLSRTEDLYNLRVPSADTAWDAWDCPTLPKLLETASGMAWPLYTLFHSMLQFSSIVVSPTTNNVAEVTVEFLLKLLVGVLLLVPLVALCVVLIMRVFYLWLYIAISPFLVVWYVFNRKVLENKDFLNRDNVLWLIFLPVIVIFALSLSLVFLSLVIRADEVNEWKGIVELIGAELTSSQDSPEECYKFMGTFELCFTARQRAIGTGMGNFLTYIVVNSLAIAVMWFLVFAALKSSKIVGGVVGSIEWLATWLMKSVPILPGGLSYGGLQVAKQRMEQLGDQVAQRQYNEQFAPIFDRYNANRSTDKQEIDTDMKTVSTASSTDPAIQTKAQNIIKRGAHQNTSYRDYNNLWSTLGAAAGVKNHNSLRTLDDALNNQQVFNWLQTTTDENGNSLFTTLSSSWNRSTGKLKANNQADMYKAYKQALERNVDWLDRHEVDGRHLFWSNNRLYVLRDAANSIEEFLLPRNDDAPLQDMASSDRKRTLEELSKLLTITGTSDALHELTHDAYKNWFTDEIITQNPQPEVTQRTIGNTKFVVRYATDDLSNITHIAEISDHREDKDKKHGKNNDQQESGDDDSRPSDDPANESDDESSE